MLEAGIPLSAGFAVFLLTAKFVCNSITFVASVVASIKASYKALYFFFFFIYIFTHFKQKNTITRYVNISVAGIQVEQRILNYKIMLISLGNLGKPFLT